MLRSLKQQLQKIRQQGSFMRHVSIASSWNAAIIISQFILSPIITRIFEPAEYSLFAIFNSIVLNVTLFSTFRYSEAIVLTESKQQRNNLVALIFILVCAVALVSFIILFVWKNSIITFFDTTLSADFLLLIPVSIWLASVLDILLSVNIQRKYFFINGLTGFSWNLFSRLANIAYGLLVSAKGIGLVFGDLAGKVMALGIIVYPYKTVGARWKSFKKSISVLGMKQVAIHFKSFPLYFLPSTFLVYLSGHLPIFFFQWQFGAAVLGAYALASSLLDIFNRLVPYTLAPLVLQKVHELKNVSHEVLSTRLYRLFSVLSMLSFFIFICIALLADSLFPWVFGHSWSKAGTFASILAISYAFNFVAIALTEVYNVMGQQRTLLGYSILNVILRLTSMALIVQLDLRDTFALLVFGMVSSLGSIVQIIGVFAIL
ncbi:MAG: oligosaccharide flippase family protein, partial [Flammeovirgaceae bacterium]|nr:oligosaccharide flippase family protein [Flammeovirgaceae bacterium]